MSSSRGKRRWTWIVLGAVLGLILGWAAASYAERFRGAETPSVDEPREAQESPGE